MGVPADHHAGARLVHRIEESAVQGTDGLHVVAHTDTDPREESGRRLRQLGQPAAVAVAVNGGERCPGEQRCKGGRIAHVARVHDAVDAGEPGDDGRIEPAMCVAQYPDDDWRVGHPLVLPIGMRCLVARLRSRSSRCLQTSRQPAVVAEAGKTVRGEGPQDPASVVRRGEFATTISTEVGWFW